MASSTANASFAFWDDEEEASTMCNDDDDKEAYSSPAMNVSPAPMVLNIDGGHSKKHPSC